MLTAFLDDKFAGQRRVPLKALVLPIRSQELIPKGSLVVMASGDFRIRLKILDKDTSHKGFSQPLALNGFATEHKITANYLLWYLSQEPVTAYLLEHARGSVFIRVPRKVLYSVLVPLPTRVVGIKPVNEFSTARKETPFSALIANLHNDYLLNVGNKRHRTAAIIAGAICEVILYQLLAEHGVNQNLLKDDRGLGFGKLLDYVRVLKLDQTPRFPMSQLVEMQRTRNHAVHAGLLINKERQFEANDLNCFNPIIRYFGL